MFPSREWAFVRLPGWPTHVDALDVGPDHDTVNVYKLGDECSVLVLLLLRYVIVVVYVCVMVVIIVIMIGLFLVQSMTGPRAQ